MPAVRTSESHPIRVDWLPTPWAGKVGLTFAPGKQQDHPATGLPWRRDVTADLARLHEKYETRVLVSLLEDHEYEELRITSLLSSARALGWEVLRLPIADGGTPRDAAKVVALVAAIRDEAEAGRNVVIHCKGGLGRAGTIGGCVLVAAGHPVAEALALLREARGPHAPETAEQADFVRAFVPAASRPHEGDA